ncbi:hypothetical protein OSB04_021337 [Centaurea solstitialis]|uniref:Uncharacterized protein n=1 Tax=Centaurea solstitialis TaxID=347529 RepID=A0AA38WG54_9ASTR|nr:hypothetical protein OSB04_021337 [Centaurea solstitialis]
MVLWEITLGTAYFLGLKRTYKLALRIQRRLVHPKYPKFRLFLHSIPILYAYMTLQGITHPSRINQERLRRFGTFKHEADYEMDEKGLVHLYVNFLGSVWYVEWTREYWTGHD